MNNWFWVACGSHVAGGILAYLVYRYFQRVRGSTSFFTPLCRLWILSFGIVVAALYGFWVVVTFPSTGLREVYDLFLDGLLSLIISVLLYWGVCYLAQRIAKNDMSIPSR